MVETMIAQDLTAWIDAKRAAMDKRLADQQAEQAEEEAEKRETELAECRAMLDIWGVPGVSTSQFPYLSIGAHEFIFCRDGYINGFGPRYCLKHVIDTPTGKHIHQYLSVESAEDLARWLSGEHVHNAPPPEPDEDTEPAAPTVPQVYRVNECTDCYRMGVWLNQQAAEGYELHSMTGATDSEGTYLWAIVRKVQP